MRRPSRQAGYNLVMLMVLLTVLNIVIAASLPAWSAVIRRDKEEELIFRGLQYAEGIRRFKNRFERDPVRLEELIEVEPRMMRKLWKDPMTENGKWGLISALAPQTLTVPGQNPPGVDGREDPEDVPEDEQDGDSEGEDDGFSPKKDEVQVGPIKGVHSKSRKTSFLLFNGKDRYDEWHFTDDLFLGGVPNGGGANGGGANGGGSGAGGLQGIGPGMVLGMGQTPQRARWIGRPLPAFLQPPQGAGLPQDGQGPGNEPDPDGRGGPRKP